MKISLPGKITLVFISIIISITITEILLRVFEIKPWENIIINKPQIFKPDTALGWKAKKGNYIIPPLHQLGKKFNMSFDEDGQRKTGERNSKVEGEILVIGGSFAQGWGVSDESTFSSKLQKKYTNFKVYNFGQGGYGSIQSFLLLEEQIPKMKSPKLVIYGFIEHHEYRNVARSEWLRVLELFSWKGHVKTPYGTIGKNNKLIIHPPIGYINLPLREVSSLVTLFEKVYMKQMSKKGFPRDSRRKKQQKLVTEKTILQMKEISKKFDAEFILIILDWSNRFTKDHYESFLKKNEINFVNCAIPLVDEMVLLGDYHPSEKAHSHYNECLTNYIKKNKILSNNLN